MKLGRLEPVMGNILDTDADCVILPVGEPGTDFIGNIAEQFLSKIGAEHMSDLTDWPVREFNGGGGLYHWVDIDEPDVKFKSVCLLPILQHAKSLHGNDSSADIASRSLRAVLNLHEFPRAARDAYDIASPPLTGNWRTDYTSAIYMMHAAVDHSTSSGLPTYDALYVYEIDKHRFDDLQQISSCWRG